MLKKFIKLFVCLLCITPSVLNTAQSGAASQDEQLAEFNRLITSVPLQTQQLRRIVVAIIQKSEPATIKHINHAQVRAWALTLQQFLKTVNECPLTGPSQLALKSYANRGCVELIQSALAHNLQELPALDPQIYVNMAEGNLELSYLFQLEEMTRRDLERLEDTIKNLGLTLGNKIARKTELLVKRCIDNPWLQYGTGLTALTLATVFSYRWLYGTSAITITGPDKSTFTLDMPNIERTQKYIKEILEGGAAAAPSFIGAGMLHASSKPFAHVWNKVQEKFTTGWRYCKGVESVLDSAGYEAIDDNTITFASNELIGFEEQIKEIAPILDCCTDLDEFVRRGNKPQYGTLLIGPSGCGKTLFSHALAGEIHHICKTSGKPTKVTFKELSCWDLKFTSLRQSIQNARQVGGVVVLFIDEIHNLAMQTTKDSLTLNDFLIQMADLYSTDVPNSYVFLIAATNQPELLGTSLLVPGRFGKIVRFSYPNSEKRKELFTKLLPRAGINPGDVDIDSLVRQTGDHVSFGKLRSLINEARIKAEAAHEIVGQKHLQEVIDTMIHRFKRTIDLTMDEKKTIAAYQAAKAVAHSMVASNLHVERITISGVNQEVQEINEFTGEKDKFNPNKNMLYTPRYGAIVTYRQHENITTDDLLEMRKQCKCLVAGSCGQDILFNTHSTQYQAADIQKALELAREIILDGKEFNNLSEARKNEVCDAAETLVNNYRQEIFTLLTSHKNGLEALVAILCEHITISGQEAQNILNSFVIPAQV